ncbi:hypothetical protein NHX12_024000 [Muraenolepis orangiensis]|uniref:Poly [ADP-ribose] polymerase n=1 Tax=Muraenolepis orangiensis TaxID=630683 RepID=A0A9Q0ELS6_9TELE|nr:hypothetical protein NHX12_024000 [Muraenolepis orangiensis]
MSVFFASPHTVAARVLSKERHYIFNTDLSVRRPAMKDQRRLLLSGVRPSTCTELVELYVENLMQLDTGEYTLTPSAGRDTVLIHLHQPLATDFYSLSAKISKKLLDSSKLTIEQMEQTDSVLVENLHPGISVKTLMLHFDGLFEAPGLKVKEVVMLSESTAQVSFVDFEAVEHVLKHQHKLNDTTLTVSPYYLVFNQPSACQAQKGPSQSDESVSSNEDSGGAAGSQVQILDPVQLGAASLAVDGVDIQPLPQTALVTINSNMEPIEIVNRSVQEVTEVMPETHSVDIAIQDPAKLELFQISTLLRDVHQTHPNVDMRIQDEIVYLTGCDRQALEGLRSTIVDFLDGVAQETLTVDAEQARFLECDQDQASLARVALVSKLCAFCISVEKEYECMLYSTEWTAFLQTLGLCSARISEDGTHVNVLTLKGLEDEKRGKVIEFLLAPIEQETFIPMELGRLKYVQMYFHQLMAEMNQVAGVARYLVETEGTDLLNEMRAKFQICISLENVHWAPLQNQDIFEAAWKLMSHINLQEVASAGTAASQGNEEEDGENLDLYTAGGTGNLGEDAMALGDTGPSSATTGQWDSGQEEQNQLSLAIQNSLHSTVWTEEDELQRALELSKQQSPFASYQISGERSMPRSHSTLIEDIRAAALAHVEVFAGMSGDLSRANIALTKRVSLRQVEESMEQKGLSRMSEFHRRCAQVIERKHAVKVQVQGDVLTISGFKDFVTQALPDAQLLLLRIASHREEDEILGNIQWARREPPDPDAPYPPNAILLIENTYRMKEKEVAVVVAGQPRVIDLVNMLEHNVATGKSMNVVRSVLSNLDLDMEQLEQVVTEEECSLLSKLSDVSRVDESSEEFQEVARNFYGTTEPQYNRIKIVKVEKLGNRLLHNQYKLKKASIYQSGTSSEVERTLYHGTSEASVKEIYLHGFNRSFCGKNATAYGMGVYFALSAKLSLQDQYSPPNADGHKFIFVAKVLTGDFTQGSLNMKAAPLKENDDIPLRYDSVTDNLRKPTMFVIFNDTQAYPEYLITCLKTPL